MLSDRPKQFRVGFKLVLVKVLIAHRSTAKREGAGEMRHIVDAFGQV